MRVEDIDPPRAQDGAVDSILAALDAYGFEWDGPVTYQSDSRAQHDAAIQQLLEHAHAYPCGCSRRDLEDVPTSSLGPIYPGTCRDGTAAEDVALRVRTTNAAVVFDDLLQGQQTQSLERESGDFVVLRKDGLIAYHLAVVVDDYLQEVTDIVRGIDLLDSTPRQIWLQQLLGYPTPSYAHIPVAINAAGEKLSKSSDARAIDIDAAGETLWDALTMLKQAPPDALRGAPVAELWQWALDAWNISKVSGKTELLAPEKLYQTPNSAAD